jgi:hypothetical protein
VLGFAAALALYSSTINYFCDAWPLIPLQNNTLKLNFHIDHEGSHLHAPRASATTTTTTARVTNHTNKDEHKYNTDTTDGNDNNAAAAAAAKSAKKKKRYLTSGGTNRTADVNKGSDIELTAAIASGASRSSMFNNNSKTNNGEDVEHRGRLAFSIYVLVRR